MIRKARKYKAHRTFIFSALLALLSFDDWYYIRFSKSYFFDKEPVRDCSAFLPFVEHKNHFKSTKEIYNIESLYRSFKEKGEDCVRGFDVHSATDTFFSSSSDGRFFANLKILGHSSTTVLIEEEREDGIFDTIERYLSVDASFDEYRFDENGTFSGSKKNKETILEGLDSICAQFSRFSTNLCNETRDMQ